MKGTVNGVTTVYIVGLYEYVGGANTRYYTGPGGGVAMRRTSYASGNGVFYLLTDRLNSTARIVNSAGAIQSTQYYYPFGGNRGGAFSTLTTKRFTGQYHESTLPGGEGLSYYNARWYDAKLGRFISADTIVPSPGNPQSLNRYSYVLNNPLRFSDPSGHKACERICPGDNITHNISFGAEYVGEWNTQQQKANTSKVEQVASVVLGFVPGFGDGYDAAATVSGADPITGERLSLGERGLMAVGMLLPFIGGKALREASEIVAMEFATMAKGQRHHIFSTKIMKQLGQHETLAGMFQRDALIVQALDDLSHRGYQTWHREYDAGVVKWLENHPKATPTEFLNLLQGIYSQPDLQRSFPGAVDLLNRAMEVVK